MLRSSQNPYIMRGKFKTEYDKTLYGIVYTLLLLPLHACDFDCQRKTTSTLLYLRMIEPCSFWKNPEGIKLACYEWPKPSDPKFVFYLVHGYMDRLNAYPKLIKMITESGGIIYSHYHFAHGESDPYPKDHPKRCQIENLYRTARDLNLRVEEIKKIHPSLPLVVLGHSLGGLISTLMAKEHPENIEALILEAPAFKDSSIYYDFWY